MKTFSMIALTDFDLGGCSFKDGDRVEASAVEAAMLNHNRRARFATPADQTVQTREMRSEPALAPEPDPSPKKRRSRRYNRRDMLAEK